MKTGKRFLVMYSLVIDTTTSRLSIGLFELRGTSYNCLGVFEADNYRHTKLSAYYVRELLSVNAVRGEDIDSILVSRGPGFYTSLRVGAVTAQSLAWVWKAKLISISSLLAIAVNLQDNLVTKPEKILALMDARRKLLYYLKYPESSDESLVALDEVDKLFESDEFDAVVLEPGYLKPVEVENLVRILESYCKLVIISHVDAYSLLKAFLKFNREPLVKLEDPVNFKPTYIRPPL